MIHLIVCDDYECTFCALRSLITLLYINYFSYGNKNNYTSNLINAQPNYNMLALRKYE